VPDEPPVVAVVEPLLVSLVVSVSFPPSGHAVRTRAETKKWAEKRFISLLYAPRICTNCAPDHSASRAVYAGHPPLPPVAWAHGSQRRRR
jgi:hypothetical protein